MRLLADILIFLGAILTTFGTDLVIATAGTQSAVGGPLGVIASLIGVAFLTTGILNHLRLSRALREGATEAEDRGAQAKKDKSDSRRG
ncbi:MAG: hypothetical protein ACREQN_08810 [Candidatus Binataceae bacterium]